MTRWEQLEEVLFDHDLLGTTFSSRELAETMSISHGDASAYISAYLDAQRSDKSRTLYVLHRDPGTRTMSARWAVGQRARDVTVIGAAFEDDVRRKVMRAIRPDLVRIAEINPRALRRATTAVDSLVNGVLVVLRNAVNGAVDTEEG